MPLITAENARELGKRGNELRWSREKAKAQEPPKPPVAEVIAGNVNEDYAREYQEHLTRLRGQLAETIDPQKIDRLCAAIARLEDVYCRYAGIPNPGSRKPAADKPARQRPAIVEPS